MSYDLSKLPGRQSLVHWSIPAAIPFDTWKSMFRGLMEVRAASAWWIGDALLFGEDHYGEKFAQIVEGMKVDYHYAANCASVARSFLLIRRRRVELSFSHHQAVMGLKEHVADEWLEKAIKRQWTREQLRNELRDAKVIEVKVKVMKEARPGRMDVVLKLVRKALEAAKAGDRVAVIQALNAALEEGKDGG